jgi:hypothetical protein
VAWWLLHDTSWPRLRLPGLPLELGFGPAIGSNGPPPRIHACDVAEPRDELAIGQRRGRLAGDVAVAVVAFVALTNPSLKALVHVARTEDEQGVVRGQAVRDVLDELLEVFEAMWLAGRLRSAASTVANHRVVPDVAGRATVGGHLGVQPLDMGLIALPTDDDGLACIDPHKGAGWHGIGSRGPEPGDARAQERAHAGRESLSVARSA